MKNNSCAVGTNGLVALLPDMAVFARVVEAGSFSGAARQLGCTPSAVSRQVAGLERALGVRLLERTTRSLRLTDTGKEVFKRCQDMLAAARSALEITDSMSKTPQGIVRVGLPKAFGRVVIQPLIPEFLRQYPKVDVQLLVTDRKFDLIGDHIDLMLAITDSPHPTLAARPLMSVQQMLCATPQYLAVHGSPAHPADLESHSCIGLSDHPDENRWQLQRGDESVTVAVHGRYASNHSEMRLNSVLHHLGIGRLSDFIARDAIASGALEQVLPDWKVLGNHQGAVYALYLPHRYLSPKCRVFIDYLVQCLG